jgi:GAF domain-containing protein
MLHWRPDLPADEEARLRALHALDLRSDPPEQALAALAELAAQLLGCPISMVTLIDRAHQRIVASVGAERGEGDRNVAFCNHTISTPNLLVVPDATLESRFAGNPFVTGDMHVRFYAGMPICAPDPETGDPYRVGAICAVDTVPRSISPAQEAAMSNLGRVAEAILSARVISGQSLELAELTHRQAQELRQSVTAFGQAERIASIGSTICLRKRTRRWMSPSGCNSTRKRREPWSRTSLASRWQKACRSISKRISGPQRGGSAGCVAWASR